MLFIVDGYNVTMNCPEFVGKSKEYQRDALVRMLSRTGVAPKGARIVVVFDARGQLGSTSDSVGKVDVVYAADADDEIFRRVSRTTGNITVVTDDMRLRARLSQDLGRGAVYLSVAELVARTTGDALGSQRRGRRGSIAREDGLPRGAKDITRELEDIWLRTDDSEG